MWPKTTTMRHATNVVAKFSNIYTRYFVISKCDPCSQLKTHLCPVHWTARVIFGKAEETTRVIHKSKPLGSFGPRCYDSVICRSPQWNPLLRSLGYPSLEKSIHFQITSEADSTKRTGPAKW